ncbi:MAG: altronate dehydratase family protein [Erysipelotrichaceae bacterium]|nr:altronate dehydratase family protein [Erysipelotrichaceae bacterium]
MNKIIQINKEDNVVVALMKLEKGTVILDDIILEETIDFGHKVAIKDIAKDELIIKYGYPIGEATKNIKKGEWVHTSCIKTRLEDNIEYKYQPNIHEGVKIEPRSFMGYRRENGKVGIRNEVWIIPTVGCINNVVTKLAEMSKKMIKETNIEDVVAFVHPYGCSQMGDDQENTKLILSDLITHPNAGGVLVVGLGCENSNIDELKKYINDQELENVHFINLQDHEDEITDALGMITEIVKKAALNKREPILASELIVGLKCGGSDGLSGITANPCVGYFSDKLIAQNGTTILTEVPEMFGAETILMNRCQNTDVFNKTVALINEFKDYYRNHGQTIYENPSPGNKAGGISTLEDKSLGCTQKAGQATVVDVLAYGEKVKIKGLNLLSAPGNDLVASTALACSGAHIVLFTTGRGTPFGCPVPTLKISSNDALAHKKANWIDFNAGVIANGHSLDETSNDLMDLVLKVASGELVKAEVSGYHDMAIFKQGVTL